MASESYKEFHNVNGVSVAQRADTFICQNITKASPAEDALAIQATIRTMEKMAVIRPEEAEKLIDLLLLALQK